MVGRLGGFGVVGVVVLGDGVILHDDTLERTVSCGTDVLVVMEVSRLLV